MANGGSFQGNTTPQQTPPNRSDGTTSTSTGGSFSNDDVIDTSPPERDEGTAAPSRGASFIDNNVQATPPEERPAGVGESGLGGSFGDNSDFNSRAAQGQPGPTGPRGPEGPQGQKGDTGPRGPEGPQGPMGSQGVPGGMGNPGQEGPPGPMGNPGDPGPQGDRGPIGMTGPQGNDGPPGERGMTGPTGPTGPRGQTGPMGSKGDKGDQGDPGDIGPTGPRGPIGMTGPEGPEGPGITNVVDNGDGTLTITYGDGSTLVTENLEGPQGPAGPQGQRGMIGPEGMEGPPGEMGRQGERGPRGQDGGPGPTGERGPEGPKGDQGDTGDRGPIGMTGERGPQGIQGIQGVGVRSVTQANPDVQPGDPTIISFDLTDDADFDIRVPPGAPGTAGPPGPAGPGGGTTVVANPDVTDADPALTSVTIGSGTDAIDYRILGGGSNGIAGYHMDFMITTAGTTLDLTGLNLPVAVTNFILALDGVTLLNNTDYTYSNPTVTFTRALKVGSVVEIWNASSQGEAGPQGIQGPQGIRGPQGDTGDTGAVGPMGLQGNQGIQGIRGETGASGPTGPQGTQGDTGPMGAQGFQGRFTVQLFIRSASGVPQVPGGLSYNPATEFVNNAQGWSLVVPSGTDQLYEIEGTFDPAGSATLIETWSVPFIAGAIGPVGPAGPTGPRGLQGNTGDAATVTVGTTTTGAPGGNAAVTNSGTSGAAVLDFTIPQGTQGEQGIQGEQGLTGPTGPQGEQGIQGPQGDQGVQGEQGIQGPIGMTGATGPMGAASTVPGPTGPAGPIGMTGPQGPQGDQGVRGPAGTGGTNSDFRWASDIAYVPGALTSNVFSGRVNTGTIGVSDQVNVDSLAGTPERFSLNLTGNTHPATPTVLAQPVATIPASGVSVSFNVDFTNRAVQASQSSVIQIEINRTGTSTVIRYSQQYTAPADIGALTTTSTVQEIVDYFNRITFPQGPGTILGGASTVSVNSITFGVGSGSGKSVSITLELTNARPDTVYNFAEGMNFFFFGTTGVIAPLTDTVYSRAQIPSAIGIVSTNPSVNETITLAPGLTTSTAIEADFIEKFNMNTNLQAVFTLATSVRDRIQFEHRGIGPAITVMFSLTQGDGQFTFDELVTQGTDSAGMFTAPIISVVALAPPGVPSSVINVNILAGRTPQEIAADIAAAIASYTNYTSIHVAGSRTLSYESTSREEGVRIQTIVGTQGSSNLVNTHFTHIFESGQLPATTLELYSALTASTGVEPGGDRTVETSAWRRIGT